MNALRNTLNNILLDAQIISADQLELALNHSKKTGSSIIEAICDLKILEREDLYLQIKTSLEIQYGATFTDISKIVPDEEFLNIFSEEILVQYKFIPIKRSGNVFVFGMVEPDNLLAEKEIRDRLREFKDISINKTVILEDDFNKFVKTQFSIPDEEKNLVIEQNTDELISSMGIDLIETSPDDFDLADLTDSAEEAPIIQLANSILGVAIKRGASDIHIEPREKGLIVRFRQDGVLSVYKKIPKEFKMRLFQDIKLCLS